jgi:cysteine synthase
MPEGVSRERRLIIEAYGGELLFSPKGEGVRGAMEGAVRVAGERGGFLPLQFSNMDNPAAHRYQTARRSSLRSREGASTRWSAA